MTALQCTWRTGPDAGGTVTLAPGRHLVGRATGAAVRCDDPALEAHHVVLDVDGAGTVRATQLAGHWPVRTTDGTPIRPGTALAPGSVLELGASSLRIEPADAEHRAAALGDDGRLLRVPRAVPRWNPADLTPPEPPSTHDSTVGGLVPAVLGLGGSAGIAVLLHQPMFLVFGGLGAMVAVASWALQHAAERRRDAREDAAYRERVDEYFDALATDRVAFIATHEATVPTVASARRAAAPTDELWSRRAPHADAFTVSLGRGTVTWRDDDMDPLTIPDLAIATELAAGNRLALVGPSAAGVARAVLLQLCTSCGPADVRVVVVTDRPDDWQWVNGLPHATLPDGTAAVIDEHELGEALDQLDGTANVVLVTDDADALSTRTGVLRRAISTGNRSLVAVLPADRSVPHVCTAVLTTTNGPSARWVADTSASLLPEQVRIAAVGTNAATSLVRGLASLRDPEDVLGSQRLPGDLSLADLLGVGEMTAVEVAARWRTHAAADGPRSPVGVAADGIVDVDLVRDGPHGLVAGTTGAGKSELLRTIVAGLALQQDPSRLSFVLVDHKGGAAFDALTALPHVVGTVTDLDEHLADRALRSLQAELRRRERILRAHGVSDLATLRDVHPDVVLPRLVVVIDEFAALAAEQPAFLHSLVGVAQRGRSLGVHLLLATQRPHGVVSDDIRANTNLRIALRVNDTSDSVDIVGDPAAAHLSRHTPGRAVMRLGTEEHVVFQTARIGDVSGAVAAINAAAALAEFRSRAAAVEPPWLPPLPDRLESGGLGSSRVAAGGPSVGLLDDPDAQQQTALRWSPGEGSLIVAGSPGSGVSSTLRTLVTEALSADGDVDAYVLTADDHSPLVELEGHPRVVLVRLSESERVTRLLHRLGPRPLRASTRLVVIDGLETVRRSLDDLATLDEHTRLDGVLGDGSATVLVGTAHPDALPPALLARCPHRWVLHLHDPHAAMALGAPPTLVPPPTPGRAFVVERSLTAQLVVPTTPTLPMDDQRRVAPIDAVPALVDAGLLPPPQQGDGVSVLPVGLDHTTGEPAVLTLGDGEHALVLGGGRSGKSTALTRLATAWRESHPGGIVLAHLPRRTTFDTALVDRFEVPIHPQFEVPTLFVCDDADLLDDADGALGSTISSRSPGLTVLAAARADALRHRYGHWTAAVRLSHIGLVAGSGAELDGDLLGVALPRRAGRPARPGLMWLVDHDGARLVQVAADAPGRTATVAMAL